MFCSSCGAELTDGSVCTRCGPLLSAAWSNDTGVPPGAAVPASTAASGLSDNAAGALAYITILPAILFLIVEPYNRRPFVRFHAFQSIFLCIACTIVLIALGLIPVVGWILTPLLLLALFVLWLVALLKAYNGKQFHLPVIGDIAQKQAELR